MRLIAAFLCVVASVQSCLSGTIESEVEGIVRRAYPTVSLRDLESATNFYSRLSAEAKANPEDQIFRQDFLTSVELDLKRAQASGPYLPGILEMAFTNQFAMNRRLMGMRAPRLNASERSHLNDEIDRLAAIIYDTCSNQLRGARAIAVKNSSADNELLLQFALKLPNRVLTNAPHLNQHGLDEPISKASFDLLSELADAVMRYHIHDEAEQLRLASRYLFLNGAVAPVSDQEFSDITNRVVQHLQKSFGGDEFYLSKLDIQKNMSDSMRQLGLGENRPSLVVPLRHNLVTIVRRAP